MIDALDPTVPVFISRSAVTMTLADVQGGPAKVTLHDRTDPCGHATKGELMPTFVAFVQQAAARRDVDVETCSFCGDHIVVDEPAATPPVGGGSPSEADAGADEVLERADDAPAWAPAGTDTDDSGPTRTCQHCGNEVSKRYVDVYEPDDVDQPRCCPNCEDVVRERDGTIRTKRGHGVE